MKDFIDFYCLYLGKSRSTPSVFLAQREQRWRLRRIGSDGFEFGVADAERVGDLDLRGFEHADELKSVNHRFAEVMVVGDDESFCGALGNFADALGPGR